MISIASLLQLNQVYCNLNSRKWRAIFGSAEGSGVGSQHRNYIIHNEILRRTAH